MICGKKKLEFVVVGLQTAKVLVNLVRQNLATLWLKLKPDQSDWFLNIDKIQLGFPLQRQEAAKFFLCQNHRFAWCLLLKRLHFLYKRW